MLLARVSFWEVAMRVAALAALSVAAYLDLSDPTYLSAEEPVARGRERPHREELAVEGENHAQLAKVTQVALAAGKLLNGAGALDASLAGGEPPRPYIVDRHTGL